MRGFISGHYTVHFFYEKTLSLSLLMRVFSEVMNKVQRKRVIVILEINPRICSQLIFVKSTKNARRKDNFFNKDSFFFQLEKLNIHMQENEIEPLSYIIHKNQLKMD